MSRASLLRFTPQRFRWFDVEYYPHGGERTTAEGGEVLDLTVDINPNYDFFGVDRPDGTEAEAAGPGYDAA